MSTVGSTDFGGLAIFFKHDDDMATTWGFTVTFKDDDNMPTAHMNGGPRDRTGIIVLLFLFSFPHLVWARRPQAFPQTRTLELPGGL